MGAISTSCDPADAPRVERFGTADARRLVLTEQDVPDGLRLVDGPSGPQTVFQISEDPRLVSTLRAQGARGGYLARFGGDGGDDVRLSSSALVFGDNESAAAALSFLRRSPDEALEDPAPRDARGFGEGAFFTSGRIGRAPVNAYAWRQGSALLSLQLIGASQTLDASTLSDLAHDAADRAAGVHPTGEDVAVSRAQVGDRLFREDFSEIGAAWGVDGVLTRPVGGALLLAVDAPGSRSKNAPEPPVNDAIVTVAAEHVQGVSARWGVTCRVVEGAGYYLFVVGTDGFAAIFSAITPSQPLETVAVTRSESIRRAVRAPHVLRADCAGDPIAHLVLRIDGRLALDALDDDPLAPGTVGLWVESKTGPASILFDDLTVARVAAG